MTDTQESTGAIAEVIRKVAVAERRLPMTPEIAPAVRRGPGRPKTPLEAKPQQKAAFNAYHNGYYHAHKEYVPCACGALIQKTKMTSHLKSKRHGTMVEFLARVADGAHPPPFRARVPAITL